jgi:HK97 family phage major capsid protein
MPSYQEQMAQIQEDLRATNEQLDGILGTDQTPREDALTDDERQTADDLEKKADELEAQYGKLKADQERIARNTLRRDRQNSLTTGRLVAPEQPIVPASTTMGGDGFSLQPIHKARHLRAFKGPNAHENAYASGMWLAAISGSNDWAKQWCREHLAMSGGDNIKGGALIPDEFEATIIDLVEEYGVFRQYALNEPMVSDTKIVPRRTGGLTAYFVGENTEITDSDLAWDNVQLVARKVAVLSKYSSELNEDTVISIADRVAIEAARAFARKEDDCGFLGTGTSTYGGISGLITQCTAATATIVTALTGNTAFSTLDLVDFESMVGKLPLYAHANAKWFISMPGFCASMLRLLDAAGGNTSQILADGSGRYFLGYPVVISQVMNSTLAAQTSTKGLAYFGDLEQAATMGNRRGVTMKQSDQRYIEYDQLAVQVTERFDIKVHDVGNTSVAGSIIMLATPSS